MEWYPPHSLKRVKWIHSNSFLLKHFPALTHLYFSDNYDEPLGPLPPKLVQLRFGALFSRPVPNSFPPLLTHLSFGITFTHSIHSFPPGLTHLEHLAFTISKHPPKFPLSLTHLTLGWEFLYVYPIFDTLPNLKYFRTTCIYPFQQIPDSFPAITHAIFVKEAPLLQTLPQTIRYLGLGREFNQPFDKLPRYLTHLIFLHRSCKIKNIANLPETLTHLTLPNASKQLNSIQLPNKLTHLDLGDYDKKVDLPQGLTHLIISGLCAKETGALPPNLTHLSLGGQHVSAEIPRKVTHLSAGRYPFPLDTLPKCLTQLALGRDHLANTLAAVPSHITYLSLHKAIPQQMIVGSNVIVEFHGFASKHFWNSRPFV